MGTKIAKTLQALDMLAARLSYWILSSSSTTVCPSHCFSLMLSLYDSITPLSSTSLSQRMAIQRNASVDSYNMSFEMTDGEVFGPLSNVRYGFKHDGQKVHHALTLMLCAVFSWTIARKRDEDDTFLSSLNSRQKRPCGVVL